MSDPPVGYRALFAIVYTASISSVYFALGVITHRAGGLTPVVLLLGGVFFQLTAMTYVEAASMHPERGGSAVFARYAFNELVSFVSGWSIVLDYTILIAVTALTVPSYLAAFWHPIGNDVGQILVAMVVIAWVAVDNLTGVSASRMRRRVLITAADLGLQALGDRARHRARVPPEPPVAVDPPRQLADPLGPRVRAADRRDRVHRARGGRRDGGRGDGQAPGGQVADLAGVGDHRRRLRWESR